MMMFWSLFNTYMQRTAITVAIMIMSEPPADFVVSLNFIMKIILTCPLTNFTIFFSE